jgi:hypothetical protein
VATDNGGVFMGSQFVKTLSISKIGKFASFGGALAGTLFDAYGVYEGMTTWGQFGENAVFTGIGFLGPVGAAVWVEYFGLNAFYPGGFNQAMIDSAPIRDLMKNAVRSVLSVNSCCSNVCDFERLC